VGRGEAIARLRRHPLARALRVDKTTIAGIQANLLHYVRGEATARIPVWQMIAASQEEIAARSQGVLAALGPAGARCELVPGRSMIGGGSLPEESLATTLIALPPGALGQPAAGLAASLRQGAPPIVARVQEERVLLDLRTVFPWQEGALISRLRELL